MTTLKPIEAIADIIQTMLLLDSGRVMMSNQKFNISTAVGLYVVVSYVSGKAIGNNVYPTPVVGGMSSTSQVAMMELIQIDLFSVDTTARDRKEEIIMALNSNYAQEICDANNISIARIPSQFNDISGVENTAMLTRYVMTIPVFCLYTTVQNEVSYYSDFSRSVPAEVITNDDSN